MAPVSKRPVRASSQNVYVGVEWDCELWKAWEAGSDLRRILHVSDVRVALDVRRPGSQVSVSEPHKTTVAFNVWDGR